MTNLSERFGEFFLGTYLVLPFHWPRTLDSSIRKLKGNTGRSERWPTIDGLAVILCRSASSCLWGCSKQWVSEDKQRGSKESLEEDLDRSERGWLARPIDLAAKTNVKDIDDFKGLSWAGSFSAHAQVQTTATNFRHTGNWNPSGRGALFSATLWSYLLGDSTKGSCQY